MLFISPTPPRPKISPEKDGDLKTQVEKLWREVNALKEIQALQTGKTPISWVLCLKGDGAGRERGRCAIAICQQLKKP